MVSCMILDKGILKSHVIPQGSGFRFTPDQLMVHIGNKGECEVLRVTLTTVDCSLIPAKYPVDQDIPLKVRTIV